MLFTYLKFNSKQFLAKSGNFIADSLATFSTDVWSHVCHVIFIQLEKIAFFVITYYNFLFFIRQTKLLISAELQYY